MCIEMLTINERLNQSITHLKRLHTLENQKKNQEQQSKNDNKYQVLVHQIAQLCHAVHYAQETFSFPYQPQAALIELLVDLQTTALKGTVDEDSLLQGARKVKPIQDQMKKEWAMHYPSLVGSVTSTLKIIQKFNSIQVTKYLLDLQNASVWQNNDSDLFHLQTLSDALTNSSAIVERLNLDQEITAFLTKVSANAATLNDLTEGILAWIRQESLGEKLMVSFK
ncbi:MAG: hypothetical protein RR505_05265 [Raoultibacter sp.]